MALTLGTRLGVYDITAPIGEGGMGQVFRARDTKLNRDVALKVLPDSFASDPDRLARFTREAQTLASLNHPHIAAIYGLEESGGVSALVMELVEGEDLAQRIARGAIPLDEALPIAKQIAEALEAAHEQGIIHRDLKPANIKVRWDGTVKILDFGLAKASEPAGGSSSGISMSPTLSMHATQAGVILGTAAYMSPEQARGKAVDKRADIWAFGAVLFEMLTGTRAFAGGDVAETLANVINKEPDWALLPATLSPVLRRCLRRCLNRDPRQRIADAQDVRLTLEDAFDVDVTQMPTVASPAATRPRLAWIAASAVMAIVAAALAVPAVQHLRERSQPASSETRLDIITPATDVPEDFALSPDGKQIVFVASGDGASRLWVRALSSTTAQPLPGTEGGTAPFWSPDSRAIGFFSDGRLRRVNIEGGASQALATITGVGRGGTWNADGIILFAASPASPLFRVSASGGDVIPVTKLDHQIGHRWPVFLPDGRHFLFGATGAETGGIFVGSLDSPTITRLTGTTADLNVSAGVYRRDASADDGYMLWVRANTLLAQRLDLGKPALTGEPIVVANPVANNIVIGHGAISASRTGVVAYRGDAAAPKQLRWFDRSGKMLGSLGGVDGDMLSTPAVSPDGHRAAVSRRTQGNLDIWLIDDARVTRFTFDPAIEGFPLWSPDGRRIAFRSRPHGTFDLYQKSADGGAQEVLLESAQNKLPLAWTAGARFLLYSANDEQTGTDLWLLPMKDGHASGAAPVPFLRTPFNERSGTFSPDGHWVAYVSNESGADEVYVRPFREPAVTETSGANAGDGHWPASTGGGIYPRWRPDGREIYYIGPAGEMMAVPFAATGDSVQLGKPAMLFATKIDGGGIDILQGHRYDVAADGRFLITTRLESPPIPITLVQGWKP